MRDGRFPSGSDSVGLLRESGLDEANLSVLDFEKLADFEGERMAERGGKDAAIGEHNIHDGASVVEESKCEGETALGIDDHKAAFANLGDDLEEAGLELRGAAKIHDGIAGAGSGRLVKVGIVGSLRAIFDAIAIVGERVIAL